MSYSVRDRAQRKLQQAVDAQEKSLVYLAEVAIEYKLHTPQVAEDLENVGGLIQQVEKLIMDVRSSF